MKFSLIIATHNRAKPLARLLKSISILEGAISEVIVVGNNNNDSYIYKSTVRHSSHPKLQIALSGKLGVNRARNAGIELATGDVLVFIDDDCYFEPSQKSFLTRLEQFFHDNPTASLVGGNYQLPAKRVSAAAKAYHIIAENWFLQGRFLGSSNWRLFGGCLAAKRSLFDTGILFNEAIEFGSAESEFVLRCLEKGYNSYSLPDLLITHDCSLSVSDLVEKAKKQSKTAEEFPIFLKSKYRPTSAVDYRESLLATTTRSSVERIRVLRMMKAYEANFLT